MATDHLHSRDFAEWVNTIFQVHSPGMEAVPLKLTGVVEKNHSETTEQFSLLFHGPMSPALPQRIHAVSHERLGEMNLFVVPHDPENGAMTYEVVFNRIADKKSP